MILPKGSIDVTKSGGKTSMEEVLGLIKKQKLTGYILALGSIENKTGVLEEVTAQLVYQDGVPKLCEAVINRTSHKGRDGTLLLMKTMLRGDNKIEMHSKIDVAPPLAFFKECNIPEDSIDPKKFIDIIKKEEEERKKYEEEKQRRETHKKHIWTAVEEWTRSGFIIPCYPEIVDSNYEDIVKWHKKTSSDVDKAKEMIAWAQGLNEIEVAKQVGEFIGSVKDLGHLDVAEGQRSKLEGRLAEVNEKRSEISRWVELWKKEGYNTDGIEKGLHADLDTAFLNLTQFMDDIQTLKDQKEQLDSIREKDSTGSFGAEIREIDFLLNDPMEIGNVQRMMENLRVTMEMERKTKEDLLDEARKFEEAGFSIDGLEKRTDLRLDPFRAQFFIFRGNIDRIKAIKEELAGLERTDLGKEIDSASAMMKDPFELQDHEKKALEIKDRLKELQKERNGLKEALNGFKAKGFNVTEVEQKLDSVLPELLKSMSKFRSKVKELEGLSGQTKAMDHRWLEGDFQDLESLLNDVSKIPQIKKRIEDLSKIISARENDRARIRSEMEGWEKEGFFVGKLREVIDGAPEEFRNVHSGHKARAEPMRALLKKLASLNTKYFQQEAMDLRRRLQDLSMTDDTKAALDELIKSIRRDWEARENLKKQFEDLQSKGWSTDGLEKLMDEPPHTIGRAVEGLGSSVSRLSAALAEVEKWDQVEKKHLAKDVQVLRANLRKIKDAEKALSEFETLRSRITSNAAQRAEMKSQVDKWKEAGYITKTITDLLGADLEKLKAGFEDVSRRIKKLESLQTEFDALDIAHFRTEAEEIEFKLNDPSLVDEITKDIASLSQNIQKDSGKREMYRAQIESYMQDGFTGAKKLYNIMEEDMAIIELEFKNFEKEIQLLRKYMESTGYVPRA